MRNVSQFQESSKRRESEWKVMVGKARHLVPDLRRPRPGPPGDPQGQRHQRLLREPLPVRRRCRGGPHQLPVHRAPGPRRQDGHAAHDSTRHDRGTGRLPRRLMTQGAASCARRASSGTLHQPPPLRRPPARANVSNCCAPAGTRPAHGRQPPRPNPHHLIGVRDLAPRYETVSGPRAPSPACSRSDSAKNSRNTASASPRSRISRSVRQIPEDSIRTRTSSGSGSSTWMSSSSTTPAALMTAARVVVGMHGVRAHRQGHHHRS